MKNYSCAELGMLIGTAVGGILSAAAFSFFGNYLFFILLIAGIAAGINIGRNIDKKRNSKKTNELDL